MLSWEYISHFRLAPFATTRCIGSYAGKGGYKDCAFLSDAVSEPITAQPEIVGAIPMDESCRFIILMSGGLCSTLHDIFDGPPSQVNKEIVQMLVEEFRSQSTLMGVAQATVNKVVQQHHDLYMLDDHTTKKREDITLLVRNINFPMPNAIQRKGASIATHTHLPVSPASPQSSDYFYADTGNTDNFGSTNSSSNSVAFR